jgi:hypothetical protein
MSLPCPGEAAQASLTLVRHRPWKHHLAVAGEASRGGIGQESNARRAMSTWACRWPPALVACFCAVGWVPSTSPPCGWLSCPAPARAPCAPAPARACHMDWSTVQLTEQEKRRRQWRVGMRRSGRGEVAVEGDRAEIAVEVGLGRCGSLFWRRRGGTQS